MLKQLKSELADVVARQIQDLWGVEHEPVVEVPPRRELGDLALPAALHLARELRKKPRLIAEELADALVLPDWVREVRIEGAGFLNIYLGRRQIAAALLERDRLIEPLTATEKIIVEHTNINPNKAAHIGHLRNAVLGDALGGILRQLGHRVEIQNYIDDTGVQVADVVVGFVDLRQMDLEQVKALPEPFDYYCWDLYSEVGRSYEADEANKELRRKTLHELEAAAGPRAEIGRLVAERIVGRHLGTMARLGIGYDVLTHESTILELDFFSQAFEKLKESGAIRLEEDGKNQGCWVMPLSESQEFAGLEDPDKVIVRSDGTVTYVGKDIAYQLWKFGLLGRDFGYRYWEAQQVWQSTKEGTDEHPAFGAGDRAINVIDARQSYLQKIVRAGLEALGHPSQAERSIHFAYEMVTLSAATAEALGVGGDGSSVEMSGRKGIGVKADDLIERLEAKSREEIESRNRELGSDEIGDLAHAIAVAAIRFFMIKATTTRVIAFDLEEALSFEGETGPYLQYSQVRAKNIQRKLADAGVATEITPDRIRALPAEHWSDDLWDLALLASQLQERLESVGESLEVSLLGRLALDLAQQFNAIYHRHPILQEQDEELRDVRIAAAQIFLKALGELCETLGIPVPERM